MLQVNEKPTTTLNAVSIGISAYETLADIKSPGSIEGVFDNSFYIKVGENKLLRVIKYNEYISASSIVIYLEDADFSFKSLGITKGMEVVTQENSLLIGNKFVFNVVVGFSFTCNISLITFCVF